MMRLSEEERLRRRRKNIVLGVLLAALVALFYLITLVKLSGNVQ